MRQANWRAFCIFVLFCFVAVFVLATRFGGCTTMIETAAGGTVPMKCHWTYQSIRVIAAAGFACAIGGFFCDSKMSRRIVASLIIVMAALTAVVPTDAVIGLCANPEMHCHTAAWGVWVAMAIAAVLGIVMLVLSDPDKQKQPKQRL